MMDLVINALYFGYALRGLSEQLQDTSCQLGASPINSQPLPTMVSNPRRRDTSNSIPPAVFYAGVTNRALDRLLMQSGRSYFDGDMETHYAIANSIVRALAGYDEGGQPLSIEMYWLFKYELPKAILDEGTFEDNMLRDPSDEIDGIVRRLLDGHSAASNFKLGDHEPLRAELTIASAIAASMSEHHWGDIPLSAGLYDFCESALPGHLIQAFRTDDGSKVAIPNATITTHAVNRILTFWMQRNQLSWAISA